MQHFPRSCSHQTECCHLPSDPSLPPWLNVQQTRLYAVSFKICLVLSKSTWSYVGCQTPVSTNINQQPGHISNGGSQLSYTAMSAGGDALPGSNQEFFHGKVSGAKRPPSAWGKTPTWAFCPTQVGVLPHFPLGLLMQLLVKRI